MSYLKKALISLKIEENGRKRAKLQEGELGKKEE